MGQKIKVMHLISSSAFFGAERVVAELSKYSSQCGVKTVIGVLVQDQALIDLFRQAVSNPDVKIISFDGSSSLSWKVIKKIICAIKKYQINIIHSHGYKSDMYAFFVRKNFKARVSLIATNHNWIGMTAKELMYQFLDSQVLRRFDFVIAVSRDVREQMVCKGVKQERIDVIGNGIDIEDPDFDSFSLGARKKLGLGQDVYLIGCVARFTPEKAHIDLIHAFSEINKKDMNVRLVLIGDGPERRTLENECRKLGLADKVVFTGNRSDVRSLYVAFDAFTLVSKNEGLPMVLLEAMASALPVVVTKVGAIPTVIEHDVNGIIVLPSHPKEIANALLKCKSNSDFAKEIGTRARETVISDYSSKKMAQKYEVIYRHVCINTDERAFHNEA